MRALTAAIAVLAVPLTSCGTQQSVGVLRDLVSQQPIAGATVTLDCRRELFHGSQLLRVVETVTDQDGRYSFSAGDTVDCNYVHVAAQKEGFTAPHIPDSSILVAWEPSATVPSGIWLVRVSDVSRLRLEGLLQRSNMKRVFPSDPMPEADYTTVNTAFHESIRIASSPEEIRWVQQNYCERLRNLWTRIPEDEKSKHLATQYANVVMYPDVRAYCQK